MKESYEEDGAHHFGLQRKDDRGNKVDLSVRVERQHPARVAHQLIEARQLPAPAKGISAGVPVHYQNESTPTKPVLGV